MRGCEPIGRETLASFARAGAGADAGSRKRPKLAFPLCLAESLILHLSGQAQLDVQDTKHPENVWWVQAGQVQPRKPNTPFMYASTYQEAMIE